MQNGTATLRDRHSLTELHILLLYDLAIVVFDVDASELKTYVHTESCIWLFIEALFIIAQTWKQPRCPSVGEWKNKLAHPYNGILFSNIKKWSLKPQKTWKNLKGISWVKEPTMKRLHVVWHPGRDKVKKVKISVLSRVLGVCEYSLMWLHVIHVC